MLEVKNLVKKYGDHYAVKGLSFTLEDGKIYGFLGPNGAGKSTTMNMITGYISSTDGEVIVNGHEISKDPEEAKRCIGYLPEIPPLYTDMTVKEYLVCVADLKKIPAKERDAVAIDVMEQVKITDMENRLIKNLSKGYKQRVGIAQALIGNPSLIILDEPTVGLDPQQILEIRSLVKGLGQKHTVIISSHILTEISEVCDQVLIIKKGELIASGSADQLETMFEASETIELEVEGFAANIRNAIDEQPSLRLVSLEENPKAGTCKVVVKQLDKVDSRAELFYDFAARKMPILEMHKTKYSLEDMFLELTQADKEA